MGNLSKLFRIPFAKPYTENQNPDAKLCPNKQESTKPCVYFKLQFIDPGIPKQNRDAKLCFTGWDFLLTAKFVIGLELLQTLF